MSFIALLFFLLLDLDRSFFLLELLMSTLYELLDINTGL